jgi:hypothetical protein
MYELEIEKSLEKLQRGHNQHSALLRKVSIIQNSGNMVIPGVLRLRYYFNYLAVVSFINPLGGSL